MDNVKAAFRTAMGGYNKQDVNNYIAGLCERFESEKKALEEKNAALEAELAKARGAESEKAKNPKAELAALSPSSRKPVERNQKRRRTRRRSSPPCSHRIRRTKPKQAQTAKQTPTPRKPPTARCSSRRKPSSPPRTRDSTSRRRQSPRETRKYRN